jgi:hypothetical protein
LPAENGEIRSQKRSRPEKGNGRNPVREEEERKGYAYVCVNFFRYRIDPISKKEEASYNISSARGPARVHIGMRAPEIPIQ